MMNRRRAVQAVVGAAAMLGLRPQLASPVAAAPTETPPSARWEHVTAIFELGSLDRDGRFVPLLSWDALFTFNDKTGSWESYNLKTYAMEGGIITHSRTIPMGAAGIIPPMIVKHPTMTYIPDHTDVVIPIAAFHVTTTQEATV